MPYRLEEAQAQVFIGHVGEEFAEQGIVFRLHRSHPGLTFVGQGDGAFPFLGIRQDGEARMPVATMQTRQWSYRNACIHRNHAFPVGKQGIDVQLGKLRDIGRHLRQLHQYQRYGVLICGRHVAIRLEDARHAGAADHFVGQTQVQWRQGQGLVVDYFHCGATAAEHHHGTKSGVVGNTGDQLTCLGPKDHRVQGDTFDTRIGQRFARAPQDGLRGFTHCMLADQIEAHAIHIRFVRNVLRKNLHRHRIAPG